MSVNSKCHLPEQTLNNTLSSPLCYCFFGGNHDVVTQERNSLQTVKAAEAHWLGPRGAMYKDTWWSQKLPLTSHTFLREQI